MILPYSEMELFLQRHIEKIVFFTEAEFVSILSHFRPETMMKRGFLIRENESVKNIYFIASGLVKLVYTDNDAKEHIISFAMEDWWETDFEAFYLQTKSIFTLQCIEDTSLYSLSLDNYRKLCAVFPKMERFFLDKSVRGHIANQKRILSFITLRAKDRYEQFLALYPSLLQRIPKSMLASYLGVSRETLSRLF